MNLYDEWRGTDGNEWERGTRAEKIAFVKHRLLVDPSVKEIQFPISDDEFNRLADEAGYPYGSVKLTDLIRQVAGVVRVDANWLLAAVDVETGMRAFDDKGRATGRFELHLFNQWMQRQDRSLFNRHFKFSSSADRWHGVTHLMLSPNGDWEKIHNGSQDAEWLALTVASQIDREAAYRSFSCGLGQLLGNNARSAGYGSAEGMVLSFCESETYQLWGWMTYLSSVGALHDLRTGDIKEFVRAQNGGGQIERYEELIRERHARLSSAEHEGD